MKKHLSKCITHFVSRIIYTNGKNKPRAQPVNIPKLKSEEIAENLKAITSPDFKYPELKPILMDFLAKAKDQQDSLAIEIDRNLKPKKWRQRILKYQNINRNSPEMKKLKEILQTKNLP